MQCKGYRKIDAVPGRLRMEEICDLKCVRCGEKEKQKTREVALMGDKSL